jgi:ATP-dependent DNA helicase RecG
LSLRLMKRTATRDPSDALEDPQRLANRFIASLPFPLTGAQSRAFDEVDSDLRGSHPMVRLVQGDVGCGKTIVAAAAAARAAGSGMQAAFMAPTELLAEQHWRNFRDWFHPLGLPVALLSGSQPVRTRRSALEAIASGEVQLVVGTHALFQEGIDFARLALIIVDEQHRFGVRQRLRLQEKGRRQGHFPHQLIMTATPIPRTLAMTAYADLDISVIDEMPPGRTPVQTVVVPEQRRDEVVARVLAACRSGRQVYWVCPLIDESDELRYQAAEETAALLAEALPDVRVGIVHGRMPPGKKEQAMQAFKANQIQLLVATTVIEVGVDVPNATLMVIENAERMGLAQLHQLRGRVGRGKEASTCVLLYRGPLSQLARERLKAIRETSDGFEIARRDLQLRGPGELLGTRQTGLAQLRVADLVRDADLLPRVQDAAELILARHPDNIAPLAARWIASGERYATVG